MTPADIRKFFEDLNKRIASPVQVIITGGAAAILRGAGRATYDIDFQIRFKRPADNTAAKWDLLQKALVQTGLTTGITPQYGETIDRWGSIALPTKKNQRYAQIGNIELFL